MVSRPTYHTPFTTDDKTGEIVDSLGNSIADVETVELAKFMVKACNRYRRLLAIFDLCRGRHDNLTQPYTYAHDKAFDILKKEMDDDLTAHGR